MFQARLSIQNRHRENSEGMVCQPRILQQDGKFFWIVLKYIYTTREKNLLLMFQAGLSLQKRHRENSEGMVCQPSILQQDGKILFGVYLHTLSILKEINSSLCCILEEHIEYRHRKSSEGMVCKTRILQQDGKFLSGLFLSIQTTLKKIVSYLCFRLG